MSKEASKRPLVFEDAKILFRNFSGVEGTYNRKGDRNFVLLLEEDVAQGMAEDGWNIKWLKARNEDEEPQAYVEVAVNFRGRPPRVVMITSRGKTQIGEDEVSILDWAEIRKTDLIIRPYHWEVSGKTGVKAYLQALYVTIEEDELELKYVDVPDSAVSSMSPYTDDLEQELQ